MTDFKTLQDAHLRLLTRQDAEPNSAAIVPDAQAYIAEVVAGSTWIADPGERDLLRAYLRYWAGVIYERTGAYPKTELRPAESAAITPPTISPDPHVQPSPRPEPSRRAPASGLWWLMPLLGLLVLLALAFAFVRFGRDITGEAINPSIPNPATALPQITRT